MNNTLHIQSGWLILLQGAQIGAGAKPPAPHLNHCALLSPHLVYFIQLFIYKKKTIMYV